MLEVHYNPWQISILDFSFRNSALYCSGARSGRRAVGESSSGGRTSGGSLGAGRVLPGGVRITGWGSGGEGSSGGVGAIVGSSGGAIGSGRDGTSSGDVYEVRLD